MTRVRNLTGGLDDRATRSWPGAGPRDTRVEDWSRSLNRAAALVNRYGSEVRAEQPDAAADIAAARTRLLHGLYVASHATTVALQEHSREWRDTRRWGGRSVPLASTRSPLLGGGAVRWAPTFGAIERNLARHLDGRRANVVRAVSDGDFDETRLDRAIAAWGIHAHRVLLAQPSPANVVLVAHVESVLCEAFARETGSASAARDELFMSWQALARQWRDLCLPRAPLHPTLAAAASEVRSALAEGGAANLSVAAPASGPHLTRSQVVYESTFDLAHVIARLGEQPDLRGPARVLARRAADEAERSDPAVARRAQLTGPSVSEVSRNAPVPLPHAVANRIRESAQGVVQRAGRAVTETTTEGVAATRSPHADPAPQAVATWPLTRPASPAR